jgi:fructokinase
MYDVAALGELLIDFTYAGLSESGNILFERNAGGAPANVLAAVSRLGCTGAFIGKVGNDAFGRFLAQVLDENKIETRGLKYSDDVNTTLAFVHLDEKGDRSFSFYRKPGADITLEERDIEYGLIENAKIFHFGSLSMTDEPSKSATIKAVRFAKSKGKIISYDPNWRPLLWEDETSAKCTMLEGMEYADIVKLSDNELSFLTGTEDLEYGSKLLFDKGIKLVVITLGARGCFYKHASGSGRLDTYDIKVVDTTGAGDAFLGGLLFHISRLQGRLESLNKSEIEAMLDFSNAVGALCASRRGGIPAMPDIGKVKECMENIPKLIADNLI